LVNHSVDSSVDIKQNPILFALLGVVFAGIIVSIAALVVTRTKVLSRKKK
jgi:sortase family protein